MRLVAAALLFSSAAAAQPAPPPPPLPPPPPPIWNPKAPENKQLAPAFSIAAVTPVLAAIGARAQTSDPIAGQPVLLITFRNGRTALLTFSSCEAADRCKALGIQSFWAKSAKVPLERTAEAIEKFNQRYAFAKAFVTPDGRASLQRYLTGDFGFIRGDLAVNLLVFADQAERLAVEFLEPLEKAAK